MRRYLTLAAWSFRKYASGRWVRAIGRGIMKSKRVQPFTDLKTPPDTLKQAYIKYDSAGLYVSYLKTDSYSYGVFRGAREDLYGSGQAHNPHRRK
jgi:hypothetical protein